MTRSLELVAPFDGRAVPLTAVPDPVFSALMMGDGLAIEPASSTLLAPCGGVVTHLARTGHALTLTSATGIEVLIHIGIDTVSLKGLGFKPLVGQGQSVAPGQPLVEVDFDAIAPRVPSLVTMVVFSGSGTTVSFRAEGGVQAGRSRFLAGQVSEVVDDGHAPTGQPFLRQRASVTHANGLHARPATLIRDVARRFVADLLIEHDGRTASARSVTALMGLGVDQDIEVTVLARGSDAAAALAAVAGALQSGEPAGSAARPAETAAPLQRQAAAGATEFPGVTAAPGLAVGRLVRLDRTLPTLPESGAGIAVELDRFARALAEERTALAAAAEAAGKARRTNERDILYAHLALLDDPELVIRAEQAILQGQSAGFAFHAAIEAQCRVLQSLGSTLLAERMADLRDIEQRVLAALGHPSDDLPVLAEPSILVAADLLPSQLARLPRETLAGIALAQGGVSSHVAIIARTRGIPALVAAGPNLLGVPGGQQAILDAERGLLSTTPDADQVAAAQARIALQRARRDEMRSVSARPAQTLDGTTIEVAGNIGNLDDAREAGANGADGIGLLRTEFLFMDRDERPAMAEQQAAYQAILDAMPGHPVTIRTMDIGGDKPVPYLSLPDEENPALGLRGVRLSFADTELFDSQLRALLGLQPLAQVRVLLPMIAEVDEILRVRERIDRLAAESGLSARPQLGVMIEVPSAALLSERLARHVDFFSIGTNDLSQYTLAMDRGNPDLASRLDQMHPAVLRLIAMTVEGARKHGRRVGVCGGVASDLSAVPVLLGLGVTELSVTAPLVAEVKALVRSLRLEQCESAAAELLALGSAAEVRAAAARFWPQSGAAGREADLMKEMT